MSKKDLAMVQERRAALDRVLAAAKAECNDMVRVYDCAIWLLYACARDDALAFATEALEGEDADEKTERLDHSTKDELVESMEAAYDSGDGAVNIFEDQMELGKLLDPGYNKPIIGQDDWLNPNLLAKKPASTR